MAVSIARSIGDEDIDGLARSAARVLAARQARKGLFGPVVAGMFGEPIYDILLDLYVAGSVGRRVDVSNACLAAGVPTSTALRHVARMVAAGLVAREADPTDRRRVLLSLTPEAEQSVKRHLIALHF